MYGSEWSDKFMQHIPSRTSHLCPCAKRRKWIAALFCKVACLIESTSVSKGEREDSVALVCLASQHPNLFNLAKAWALATPIPKWLWHLIEQLQKCMQHVTINLIFGFYIISTEIIFDRYAWFFPSWSPDFPDFRNQVWLPTYQAYHIGTRLCLLIAVADLAPSFPKARDTIPSPSAAALT